MMAIAVTFGLCGGVACCVIAQGKGRSPLGWFVVGLLVPVVGVIAISMTSRLAVPAPRIVASVAPEGSRDPQAQSHLETTTMDALHRLATLKERGVVTTLEYDAKKAELMARL